jgi:hypothetical protein
LGHPSGSPRKSAKKVTATFCAKHPTGRSGKGWLSPFSRLGLAGKEKMPWLGRSQAEKSAQAVVGIRLVDDNLSIALSPYLNNSLVRGLGRDCSIRDTGNARTWAGQAENPPKSRWAFGWIVHLPVHFANHAIRVHHDSCGH